jgi:hypothetical protein
LSNSSRGWVISGIMWNCRESEKRSSSRVGGDLRKRSIDIVLMSLDPKTGEKGWVDLMECRYEIR